MEDRHSQIQTAFQVLYSLHFRPAADLEELETRFCNLPDVSRFPDDPEETETPSDGSPEDPQAEENPPALPEEAAAGPAEDGEPAENTPDGPEDAPAGTPEGQEEAGEESARAEGFAWDLVRGVWSARSRLDEVILQVSSRPMERIGRVEQIILRLGVYELFGSRRALRGEKRRNIIAEALQLAEEFGEPASRPGPFIESVLRSAANQILKQRLSLS